MTYHYRLKRFTILSMIFEGDWVSKSILKTAMDSMTSATKHAYASGDLGNVMGYGHLGDGNLHLNISTADYNDKVLQISI